MTMRLPFTLKPAAERESLEGLRPAGGEAHRSRWSRKAGFKTGKADHEAPAARRRSMQTRSLEEPPPKGAQASGGGVTERAPSPPYPSTLPPIWPASRSLSLDRRLYNLSVVLQSADSYSGALPAAQPPPPGRTAAGPEEPPPPSPPYIFTEDDESVRGAPSQSRKPASGRASKASKAPLTGTEVVHILAKRRDLKVYYLKPVPSNTYRPYDLQVVHASEALSDYYIFSLNTVLHVTDSGHGGVTSLGQWYRESVQWNALQKIRFFREFKKLKTLALWRRNVRKITFKRKCEDLQATLLIAVPHFRSGLFLLFRIIEELKATHWLPEDESKSFTLLEFKNVLIAKNQECAYMLGKLSHYRTSILSIVKERSYRNYEELQLHTEFARRTSGCREPIHPHQLHLQELRAEFARSERILLRLGHFCTLVNQVIVQSLITVIRQDATAFLANALKRVGLQEGCLFQTELCFSAVGQLALDPTIQMFQGAVSGVLLTVGDSISRMCDSCGLFLEVSDAAVSSDYALNSTSDLLSTTFPAAVENKDTVGIFGRKDFCCCDWMKIRPAVLGPRPNDCYTRLSKEQLMWHIANNDDWEQAERRLSELMQEAQSECEELFETYTWLVDIHLFLSQWSLASLEAMKGQPASLYEKHIKTVRHWAERVQAVPSFISTSKKLFIIHCTRTKESLEKRLCLTEHQLQEQLVRQMNLHSEKLIADLERATAYLRTEPQDIPNFSNYAVMVRDSVKMLSETQKHLDYIHSLRDLVCTSHRKMTEQEEALEEKMLDLWDSFFLLLKQAERSVSRRRPSMAVALDSMSHFLICDLQNVVSEATTGPFLDPTMDPEEMVSKLSVMCQHVDNIRQKLEQLSRSNENLEGNPLDLTVMTKGIQQIEARRELWELIVCHKTWTHDWQQLLFCEVDVSKAQEKVAKWQQQIVALKSNIPAQDLLLQVISKKMEKLRTLLAVMASLKNPLLKIKHWRAAFSDMDPLCIPEKNLTVTQLILQELDLHQKLVDKICWDAQAECNMEKIFKKVQAEWKARVFHMDKFTTGKQQHGSAKNSAAGTPSNAQSADINLIITGLEMCLAEIENDVMTLSNMLKSPHSADFRGQVKDLMQSLQDLERLLELFERYQRKWSFLSKMFHDTSFGIERADLLQLFLPVHETFQNMVHSIFMQPQVLKRVHPKRKNDRFHCDSLFQIINNDLSTMEDIFKQMMDGLASLCELFPRLWFFSEKEVIELLSVHPTPSKLLPFVRKFFKGVRWLKVDCRKTSKDPQSCESVCGYHRQEQVLGISGTLQERIAFDSPLKPNHNTLAWLSAFEDHLKGAMEQLMKRCASDEVRPEPSNQQLARDKKAGDKGDGVPVLSVLSKYPLQCLLVAEEAEWHRVALHAFKDLNPLKLRNIKAYNSAKLAGLGQFLIDGVKGSETKSLDSKYKMICARALVQLSMKHAQQLSRLTEVQGEPETSFEWLSFIKYRTPPESPKAPDDSTYYVDVLGYLFKYGYEYFGPEDCMMVHTPSTDRATMGILLALANYRCGFVSGPCMSGKKKAVVDLGMALGRQVVGVQCSPNMSANVVHRMLNGALLTGAWLFLDSVGLLQQGVLSSLAQHLEDIYQSFAELKKKRDKNTSVDGNADVTAACKPIVDPVCHVEVAGKSLSASSSYGCILISPKACLSEVPQSLRLSTRPVALTCPDYRIIAEVMLICAGFSDAASLSRRLVSLISLAKETLCLPDFIIEDKSSYVVVLQKMTAASERYLQECIQQREMSEGFSGAAGQTSDPTLPQNVSDELIKEEDESERTPKWHRSHISVLRMLMEEKSVVKAIISILLPVIYGPKKVDQFYAVFKDMFPIVGQFPLFQQYMEEEEKKQMTGAITEELWAKQLHCDEKIISVVLELHQAMKFTPAVILVGPSGSGKTTSYSTLAGALSRLAAKPVDGLLENDSGSTDGTPQISALPWSIIDTVVLFPNAMSHEEVFGYHCDEDGWQDGAATKMLRASQRLESIGSQKNIGTSKVKWLVMDGEPVGHPGWLDYLTTLSNPAEPFLYLSSGEMVVPSQSHFKLLMEMDDLSDASPSAVTCCTLVHFTGSELWKAVLRSEMDCLYYEYRLEQETLKIWNCLAEDLFSSTLRSLQKTAVSNNGEYFQSSTYGLQEIMSFSRLLRALLQHFHNESKEPETPTEMDIKDPDPSDAKKDEGLFLVAYIWGFGGHLHPCHWTHFDVVVRQVLFNSRYKIVVPDEVTVFDHFFSIGAQIYSTNVLLVNSIAPKYRNYAHLLKLMIEAKQPVLLAGEPASGKTSLYKNLLTSLPHIRLPANSLQISSYLRTVLCSVSSQRAWAHAEGSIAKPSNLLLFVDDLHEAPRDVFGKMSKVLETLRQSISQGSIFTDQFKLFSPGSIRYLSTCCVSELNAHRRSLITPRLSRLFSVLTLPSLSIDTILSIHSPQMKFWLDDIPLIKNIADMATCVITATTSLYNAICAKLQPTMQRPYLMFSHHDLQKVFQGMSLWRPISPGEMHSKDSMLSGFPLVLQESGSAILRIAYVWMHECMRTFSDRFCSKNEYTTLQSLVVEIATAHYGSKLLDEPDFDTFNPSPTILSPTFSVPMSQDQESAGRAELRSENSEPEDGSPAYQLHPLILQHMKAAMPKLEYGPDLSVALKAMDQEHAFNWSSSYQRQDLDALLEQFSAILDRTERGPMVEVENVRNITSKYIMHRQRVRQLLHVLRAVVTPGGHGVLMGSDRGTGRKTIVRLAARITGYQLREIHGGNENQLKEILTEAGEKARLAGAKFIILVHEKISLSARDELLVAMANRSYTGLYTEEELKTLVFSVTVAMNSRSHLLDNWVFEKYLRQIHRNIHVFLLMPFNMSDREPSAKRGIPEWDATITQMASAVSLSCCVEVYQPWSKQTLLEVAAQCLKTIPEITKREGVLAGLPVGMARVHQSAHQYASILLGDQPFSPQTYMEFIAHFAHLCKLLQNKRESKANRFSSLLAHVDIINKTAAKYKKELMKLQEKVADTKKREQALAKAVDDQRHRLMEAQQVLAEREKILQEMEEQINQARRKVKNMFLTGLKILKCLNPTDLDEVRHYRYPPEGVVRVMDAICFLFNRPRGWESAKMLLAQTNFFQELQFFDHCALTNEQLDQLGHIVQDPLFVPEAVREVSKACEPLCRWIQFVYESCCTNRQPLAKQQQLAQEAQHQLQNAKKHKRHVNNRLVEVEPQLHCVQKALEEQLQQLEKIERIERQAATNARQLERHARDWKAVLQDAEMIKQNLPGDCLVLAAIISYLAPFAPDIRIELVNKWRALCRTGFIHMKPKDPRSSLFTSSETPPPRPTPGFPITLSERLTLPLSQALGMHEWQLPDTLSARLLVKLLLWGCRSPWVKRWFLLADTEHHLEINCKSQLITGDNASLEEELECEMVICANDPNLQDKLEMAAEKGLRVLVTHVERARINPQFLARLKRPSSCRLPGLKLRYQLVHPHFFLFFSTQLPVQLLSRDIHPAILAQVYVFDLSLSSEEIQEVMLTQLLQTECEELLIQHLRMQNDKELLQKQLVKAEDALMDYILQPTTCPLESGLLPHVVVVAQETVKELQGQIQQLSEGLQSHQPLLSAARQLMRLAAGLYQALQEVSRLSPAYYFSLSGFIGVMLKAAIVKDTPLVAYSVGTVPAGTIEEATNRMLAQLLLQYRPCLFKSHAAILKLLVTLALQQHHQLCSAAERAAFLMGLEDAQGSAPSASKALPSWISPQVHSEFLHLERVPAFRGLTASFGKFPQEWEEYLLSHSSAVAAAVPCRSHAHLSLLQRALLWKTLRPSCLEGLAEAMASCHLCLPEQTAAAAEELHPGNPQAFCTYIVKYEGPVILTMPSPQSSVWRSTQPLHFIRQLASCVAETKQVKVISFGGPWDRSFVLSTLDRAVDSGHWLVLNNCHLLERWDDELLIRLNRLISPYKGMPYSKSVIHPGFRLWFISEENATSSIPAAVRMCVLPLVCDSTWDVREELSGSFRQVVSYAQQRAPAGFSAENLQLLLRCAVLHAVLLQRQSHAHLGRGGVYCWSHSDLVALVDALIDIASLCREKGKALQHIAVRLTYGGHVLDSVDLEVLESVAQTCLGSALPLLDRGPHALADILGNTDPFDLVELAKVLDHGLQDSLDFSDPLVLGISADVAAEITQISNSNLSRLLRASQTPLGGAEATPPAAATPPDRSHAHARERLLALQRRMALRATTAAAAASTSTAAVPSPSSPLRNFLQAEWEELVEVLSSTLVRLQQPAGCLAPTAAAAATAATPPSPAELSLLERRAELLGSYLWDHNASHLCWPYQLAAFANPRGLLVAVMRDAARAHSKFLSDITLHYEVFSDFTRPASHPPEAVYLGGLELRGASWDAQAGALAHSPSPQRCFLPPLCIQARVETHTHSRSEAPEPPPLPLYHCPLYLEAELEAAAATGCGPPEALATVPLLTKLNPLLCGLRRVHLVSRLRR